ncbi:glycosyltransferase family 4 protein [bacterium]|nr:glycosyltransferase family 4 protein [candidate division CSSED10-310 bacterium]
MKIALVGPSPIPYTRGGVENLLQGLHEAINRLTDHSAELIKIPVREDDFRSVLQAYRTFSKLNLDHFDLILTVKYPAWMIRHSNHIVYLCHRLRGLYDTYSDRRADERSPSLSPMRFPGPLIRRIVHMLDNRALCPERISHMFCISGTVAGRASYFHPELPPAVLHPPPLLQRFDCAAGEYFLAVSRLDAPKRMDLVIRAFRKVPGDTPLLIGGTGPQYSYLRRLASIDSRIRFAGDVSDDRLRDLYAHSIAVIYVPHAEDYGFITVEAMMSSKPVVTAADSGGPVEFIEDGVTGFVTAPNPEQIAGAVIRLDADRGLAERMGRAAKDRVAKIRWRETVDTLLAPYRYWPERAGRRTGDRRRLLVLVPYSVHPPRSGGQRRVAALYAGLSKVYDVWLLALDRYGEPHQTLEINPHLHEVRIPAAIGQARIEWNLEQETKVAVTDAAIPRLLRRTPNFIRALEHFLACSDVVISSHPYMHPFIHKTDRCRLVVHESHNFEAELKSSILSDSPPGRKLLRDVIDSEKLAVSRSDVLLTVSKAEGEKIAHRYRRVPPSFSIVPNGTDTAGIRPADPGEQLAARGHFGISGQPLALFMGAWHPPNLEAFRFIVDRMAPAIPSMMFLVVGSVLDQYTARIGPFHPPSNIIATGVVDDEIRLKALAAADIALNPMFSGSGTNLKVLEYMAAGLCVLSTELGIRGLDVADGDNIVIAHPDDFVRLAIKLSGSTEERREMGRTARLKAERDFDWSLSVKAMIHALENALLDSGPVRIPMDDDSFFPWGWYPVERWPDGSDFLSVRWAKPHAVMIVPARTGMVELRLRISGSPKITRLTVNMEETTVLCGSVGSEWQDLSIKLPPSPGLDYRRLEFRSDAWSPVDGGSTDRRILGVAVTGIRLEEAQ